MAVGGAELACQTDDVSPKHSPNPATVAVRSDFRAVLRAVPLSCDMSLGGRLEPGFESVQNILIRDLLT